MSQTYTNFEAILIDDGSEDQSMEICLRYTEQDSRFIYIHQGNAGPSVARNKGLQLSKGEWICFLDSDDTIRHDYLEELAYFVNRKPSEVVFIGCEVRKKSDTSLIKLPPTTEGEYYQDLINLSEKDHFGYAWIKVFSRKCLEGVHFDEEMMLFEDEVFACDTLVKCDGNIGVLRKPIYCYYDQSDHALMGRTWQEYCLLNDKVYLAWKRLLENYEQKETILKSKARQFFMRCKYYSFERSVNLEKYYSQMASCIFFKELDCRDPFYIAVKRKRLFLLRLFKMKYQGILFFSKRIHRKNNYV